MTGARTDLCKINLQMMRPFDQFMEEEFGVTHAVLMPRIRRASVAVPAEPDLRWTAGVDDVRSHTRISTKGSGEAECGNAL